MLLRSRGWMYLDEANFEGDFGLRVALNTVDEKKLKRLERANLGDAMKGVSLSPFRREFRSFGVDDALDLVRKISGETNSESAADTLTGSRSLKYAGDCAIDDLPEIAAEVLESYNSEAYKETSFGIIDVVTPVSDLRLKAQLDDILVDGLRVGSLEFELGLPDASEDESVAYRFSGPNLRGRYPDLLLRNYTSALGNNIQTINLATLQTHRAIAIYDDNRPERSWSIRRGLVGSLVLDGGRYATNDGEWYRIDDSFRTSIEHAFQSLRENWMQPPRPLRREYDSQRNGHFQSEASYNEEIARETGLVLLDRRLFQVPGVPGSGFELCDLLDIPNKRMIHVKKSSRQSSVLSHFFKQGANAAQQFKKFPAIVEQLQLVVGEHYGDSVLAHLNRVLSQNTKWGVEFRIADSPRRNGDFNIPFFSKISLKDEVQNLVAMDYNVAVRFIGLEPENI